MSYEEIYLRIDGENQGPFTMAELSELWEMGDVPTDAHYWYPGTAWAPVAEFKPPPTVTTGIGPGAVRVFTTHDCAIPVLRYIAAVAGQAVLGTSAVADLKAAVADFTGSRAKSMETQFAAARASALVSMQTQAQAMGANAVLGARFEHFSPSGHNTMMVAAAVSGTAVKLRSTPPPFRG